MSHKNKITSYFTNVNKRTAIAEKAQEKKYQPVDIDNDDCYIVESIPLPCSEIEDEDETAERERLEEIKSRENSLNEDEEFFIGIDDEKLLEDAHRKERTSGVLVDDTTQFLVDMVQKFIDRPNSHYLFHERDIETLVKFIDMTRDESKVLFARIYWLQWKWQRTSDVVKKYLNCEYGKDCTAQNAIKDLQEIGFLLNGCSEMTFDDWMSVLLRPELAKICSHYKIKAEKSNKETLIANLRKFCSTKSTILNHAIGGNRSMERNVMIKINSDYGDCVKISESAKNLLDHLHLLTYLGLNPAILREKRLNLLLMNLRNKKQSYPTENIDCDSVDCLFPDRDYFKNYLESHSFYEQILKLTSAPPCNHNEVVKLARQCFSNYNTIYKDERFKNNSVPIWLHGFTPEYRYIKSLEMSVGSFKSLKDAEYIREALDILSALLEQSTFRQHKKALWYNEKALILQTRLQDNNQAVEVLIRALKEEGISEEAKAPLIERAKRLLKLKKNNLPDRLKNELKHVVQVSKVDDLPFIEIYAKTMHENAPGSKARYLFSDAISGEKIYSSVEHHALLYYINNDKYTNGEHWEGRIICSLFVLLFWDIIYSPVESCKGIFISPYQEAPLDLYTDKFYENRKDKINERLSTIKNVWKIEDILEFMNDVHRSRKAGEISLFHDSIEWSIISEIVQCLGVNALWCLCERLSSAYYYTHSGFPDLTVWNPKTKEIMFVEVKGDGDKLSHKQIQWMTHLLKHGVRTEVCYVHKGTNSKTAGKKSSPLKKSPIEMEQRATKKRVKKPKVSDEQTVDEKMVVETVPTQSTPTKSSPSAKSPSKSNSPMKNGFSPPQDCYLRSPTKFSRGGVGFYTSPKKESSSPKKRLSLSLTKRRIFERDT